MRYLATYAATLVVMLALDALWLGVLAKDLYRQELGGLMLAKPNLVAAVLFYALYVFGVVIFAANPAVSAGQWGRAVVLGALFGLFAYATYDLTNLATLKGFSVKLVAFDLAWGVVISGASSLAGFLAGRAVG